MNHSTLLMAGTDKHRCWRLITDHRSLIVLLLLTSHLLTLEAYPPAPHHVLVGMVRDERGNPLPSQSAEVIFQTSSGTIIETEVRLGVREGANYRMEIPMDSGLTDRLYQPTALRPTAPFTMWVKLGTRIYHPIEMSGDLASLGKAGKTTWLNLTLGEDTDGDGLPDAWERHLINRDPTDGIRSLADVKPGDDFDKDGLSNRNEYLTGNYAYDDQNGFELTIAEVVEGRPQFEFLSVRGRTYSVLGSANLQSWRQLEFRFVGEAEPLRQAYLADGIETRRFEIEPADGFAPRFFRLKVR